MGCPLRSRSVLVSVPKDELDLFRSISPGQDVDEAVTLLIRERCSRGTCLASNDAVT